jgi:hypothetical protein
MVGTLFLIKSIWEQMEEQTRNDCRYKEGWNCVTCLDLLLSSSLYLVSISKRNVIASPQIRARLVSIPGSILARIQVLLREPENLLAAISFLGLFHIRVGLRKWFYLIFNFLRSGFAPQTSRTFPSRDFLPKARTEIPPEIVTAFP